MYQKYKNEIDDYFILIDNNGQDYKTWYLLPKFKFSYFQLFESEMSIHEYVYFWKNIFGKRNKIFIWNLLPNFYKNDNYLNDFPIENIDEYIPKIRNLRNTIDEKPLLLKTMLEMTLINQINYIDAIILACQTQPELFNVFNCHDKLLSWDSDEDLKDKLQILKIRYRKRIYNNLLPEYNQK